MYYFETSQKIYVRVGRPELLSLVLFALGADYCCTKRRKSNAGNLWIIIFNTRGSVSIKIEWNATFCPCECKSSNSFSSTTRLLNLFSYLSFSFQIELDSKEIKIIKKKFYKFENDICSKAQIEN